jgi:hypothetical protein
MVRAVSRLDVYFSTSVTADQLVRVDDPAAAPSDRSHGAVTRIETLWRNAPVAGGFFDPAIFGPLDGSSPRWGHLDVAGVTLAGRTITKIPVPPICDRMPSVVDPAARALWHGRINDAWIALLQAIRTHDRLLGLGVPAAMVAHQATHMQHHFDDVLAIMRGESVHSHHDAQTEPPDDRYTMMPCPPLEPAMPLALLFLDEDRLVVQTTAGCRVVDRAAAIALAGITWTPTGPLASSVHGDLVLFNGGQRDPWRGSCYPDGAWPEDAPQTAPLAAYDLRTRKWVMLVDDRFPAWVVDETDVAGAAAHELATGLTHDLVAGAQRASQLAQTRDGQFVLALVARLVMYDDPPSTPSIASPPIGIEGSDSDIDGGDADDDADDDADANDDASDYALSVIEVATQRPFVIPPDAPELLPVIALGLATHSTRPSVSHGSLGWRIVDPSGAVGDGEHWWYRLEGALITAWSTSGAQLAAIVPSDAGYDLVIADVTTREATIVSRAKLELAR